MSSENWKLEKGLCRCCHSEGSFKNLAGPFIITDLEEVYADMLKECFDIDMTPVPGVLSAVTYTICEACIIRLRDASEFKKQVLACEERFKDMYDKNIIKGAESMDIVVEVKQELVDSESDDDFKEDLPQEVNDDEDSDDFMDLKISEKDEKPLQEEVTTQRKYKTRTSVKNATEKSAPVESAPVESAPVKSAPVKKSAVKTKKKTKRKTSKQESADTEHDAEKKKGRDVASYLAAGRVVAPFQSDGQVVKPKFFIRDEDYNKDGDVYHCAKCEKTYTKRESLVHHVKTKHYKIPRYYCPICLEGFMALPPMMVHKLEAHNVDERVKCNLCDKMYNTKKQLKNHLNFFHMHGEAGERYKCKFCDFVTFKNVAMYKHNFKHKTVKDYHCRFCKKSFKRRATLNLHERIHTGDRRKVCAVCGQAFVQKASLNYHMTKYHPDVNF